MRNLKTMVLGLIGSMIFITAMIIVLMIVALPSKKELLSLELKRPARLWTQERWLIGEIGEERRYPLSIEQIPLKLQQAFIAIEDARFYDHSGVDLKSLIRAFWVDIAAHKKLQGGSTISMQVARNFFLSRQKTYWRKAHEMLLAWHMEQYLSKNQILELYLNKIFLGHRNFGVAAAAQFYFGKNLDQLSIGEMAILAGLPKAPSHLNPLASSDRCLQRRNHVLLKMLQHHFISQEEYEQACLEPIAQVRAQAFPQLHDPMLLDYLKRQLEQENPAALLRGDDIVTTINGRLQLLAQQALSEGLIKILGQQKITPHESPPPKVMTEFLPEFLEPCTVVEHQGSKIKIELSSGQPRLLTPSTEKITEKLFIERYEDIKPGDKLYYDTENKRLLLLTDLSGAVVILGPQAEVLALVGAPLWSGTFFNRATQSKRPIASTVKSLIFAQAFDQGYQLESLIEDAPFVQTDPQGFQWRPQNHHQKYQGTLSLETAFLRSANLATLRLSETLDFTGLRGALSQLKGHSVEDLPPSFALGSYECSPLELAKLYTAFQNQGSFALSTPSIVGQTALWHRLCSPQAAYLTAYLQERFIDRISPQKLKNCGGKTGTSQNHQDLWFAGHQHGLSCVVWVGCDQPKSLDLYAIRGAFPIWKKIAMRSAQLHPSQGNRSLPSGIKLERDFQTGLMRPIIIAQEL